MPPYLSVVACYRHYGDASSLDRIRFFVKNAKELSNRYGLDSEIIIVEAHPGVLSHVPDSKGVKVVEFTGKPFLSHLAINAGIRCASGEYILTTSRDCVFNEELLEFLASRKLRRRTLYRIDRWDVKELEHYPDSVSDLRRYCEENVSRVNGFWEPYLPKQTWAHPLAKLLAYATFFPFQVPHSNASGDFTLMHRDDWRAIRGYPELICNGLHLDSLVVYSAIFSGLRQVTLREPMRLYHVDHPRGKAPSGENVLKTLRIMRLLKRPVTLNDESWGTARA